MFGGVTASAGARMIDAATLRHHLDEFEELVRSVLITEWDGRAFLEVMSQVSR